MRRFWSNLRISSEEDVESGRNNLDNTKNQPVRVQDKPVLPRIRRLSIVPAKPEELDVVLEILDEAASWIMETGFPSVWRPRQFSRESFTDQISRGEVYIGSVDGEPAGHVRSPVE